MLVMSSSVVSGACLLHVTGGSHESARKRVDGLSCGHERPRTRDAISGLRLVRRTP